MYIPRLLFGSKPGHVLLHCTSVETRGQNYVQENCPLTRWESNGKVTYESLVFLVGILWAIRIVSVDPKVLRHLLFTNYILPLYHKCLLAALKLILYDKHLVIAREQIWKTNI